MTVRGRGVMEKCTYCIQRIRHAVIEAEREQRPLADGEIVTACQQSCPTQAIVFGDINDPDSAVARRKATVLNYVLLEELNTRPRTSYLALVHNRNQLIATEEVMTVATRSAGRPADHPAWGQPAFAEHRDQPPGSEPEGPAVVVDRVRLRSCPALPAARRRVVAVRERGRHLGDQHPGRLGVCDRRIRLVDRAGERRHVISALFYLTRSPWRAATNRIAETMLLAAAACAGIMPILHLGRQGLFYWLFTYPNVMGMWPQMRSPLWWDFVSLLCYVLMSIMFYYVGALPDLATVRDLARTRGNQLFYGLLALGWRGSARHWHNHRAVYGIMAAIMAPMVISVHSVVGLDYAGGLTPGWHSTQFPPYFFFGAVTSGTAIVIILTILVRWGYSLQDVITEYHLNALAKVMLVGSIMLSYAYLWEAWGAIYSHDLAERIEFFKRMFGSIAPLFWAEKALNSIIPQLLWFPFVRRSRLLLLLISGGIIVGMWIERVVFTISSLAHNHIPSLVVRIPSDILGLGDARRDRSVFSSPSSFFCCASCRSSRCRKCAR